MSTLAGIAVAIWLHLKICAWRDRREAEERIKRNMAALKAWEQRWRP